MPNDLIQRNLDAPTRYYAWAGLSGTTVSNLTISSSTANGTPTMAFSIIATGNSANAAVNGTVAVYAGTPAATSLLYTLGGNLGLTSPAILKLPLNGASNITLSLAGNAPAGVLTYLSDGPGGQVS